MLALRRSVSLIVALCHLSIVALAGLPSIASAQADRADGEPPTISFERIGEGVLGETQVFSATVVDEFPVESVTLHYRFGENVEYKPLAMTPLTGTDIYTASVETDIDDAPVMQYYIEARDGAGNRSIQGFAFDPIERRLADPAPRVGPVAPAAVAEAPPRADGMSTGRKVLYGVLGVLAVGAIVAVVGSDGDSDGDAPVGDDPGDDTGPLDIFVEPLP